MAYVDWSLQGHSIANCNCDFGCPCQFNTLPTHGDCRAMTAVKIDKGHFGDVDLSGLAFCGMFAWPAAIHLGNGEAFVVISDHASEAQRNALLTTLSGKETAPGATIFNVFATTFAKMHDPVFAPIEFYLDLERRIGACASRASSTHRLSPFAIPSPEMSIASACICPRGSNIIRRNTQAGARERTAQSS